MAASRSGRRGSRFTLERRNYQLMGFCVLLLVLGYSLMRIENEVDGWISLFLSPILLFLGYAGVIYAIVWRGGEESEGANAEG